MKKYIFSLVCLCCTLLPALEGQAHEYPNHPELRKSDANIVGHILDKNILVSDKTIGLPKEAGYDISYQGLLPLFRFSTPLWKKT